MMYAASVGSAKLLYYSKKWLYRPVPRSVVSSAVLLSWPGPLRHRRRCPFRRCSLALLLHAAAL